LGKYTNTSNEQATDLDRLGSEIKGDAIRKLLQAVFWIASLSQHNTPSTINAWLHINPNAFPSVWNSMLNSEQVLNNPMVMAQLIDIMLCSQTNKDSPLIPSPTNNDFVAQCLLQVPLEIFSRKDRERVMKIWAPSSDLPAQDASDGASLASAAISPAVLSLKTKIMQRPTVYDSMKYQDLVHLADALASSMVESRDTSLALFKELVRRTMSHITANLDQPRNREYVSDALNHLRKKTKPKSDSKKTHKIDYARVVLFEVLVGAFSAKESQLNDLGIIKSAEFTIIKESFKACLLGQLESLLAKSKKSSKIDKQAEKNLTLRSIIDALQILGVKRSELANLLNVAKSFVATLDEKDMDIGKRVETFISIHAPTEVGVIDFGGDVSTVDGRQAIIEKVRSLISGKDDSEKVELLRSLLRNDLAAWRLDHLLAVRHIVTACQGLSTHASFTIQSDCPRFSTTHR
jgi:nucleolar pre-ribosomal-associated protein 2